MLLNTSDEPWSFFLSEHSICLDHSQHNARQTLSLLTKPHILHIHTSIQYIFQKQQSEAPAAAPAASAPAPADTPKASAVDPTSKRKNRQSLSISKSDKETIAHNVETGANNAPAPARNSNAGVGVPPAGAAATVGYQGLPQVGSPPSALRELPALRDAPPNKREELFKLKLQLCGVIFSFDDPTSDKRGKVCLFRFLLFSSVHAYQNTTYHT